MTHGKSLSTWRIHRLCQHPSVFFQFHLRVANHRPRQSFFERHSNTVWEIVSFIHHDDDLLKGEVHGFEAGFPDAVVKEVIVIANKNISAAYCFSRRFPRAGLGRFTVRRVGSCNLNQLIDVKR